MRRARSTVMRATLLAVLGVVLGVVCGVALADSPSTRAAGPAPRVTDTALGATAPVEPLRPAVRLLPPGMLPFPIDPLPRCWVLDNFGARRGDRLHEGVDIIASLGRDVYAVERMRFIRQTVDGATSSSLSGNAWLARGVNSRGEYTENEYFYAHLAGFAAGLAVGSIVERGDVIGYVGDTGNAGAGNYHLHFEVHKYDSSLRRYVAVDPFPMLVIPGSCGTS